MANSLKSTLCIAISVALAFMSGGSIAQDGIQLEEIVVTARKRSEDVIDVPLAISALTSDAIEKGSIQGIEDIAAATPGLTFQSFGGGGLSSPVIRGLAQTDIASSDNNVGVFLNGMFINGKSNIDIGLLDIERVEVVKGPQSALFGRNSFGGAINYITKKPGEEFEGKVSVSVGTDELFEVKGSLAGPLIPGVLAGSLSLSTSEFDGTLANGFSAENLGGWDEKTNGALTLVFTPNDRFTADFFYYQGKTELDPVAGYIPNNNCGADVVTFFPRRGGDGGTHFCGELEFQDEYFVSSFAENSEFETEKAALTLSYDFDSTSLTFSTSFGDYDFDGLSDQIFSPFTADDFTRNLAVPFVGPAEDESYELRLQSNNDSALQWLVGYYRFEGEFEQFSEVFPNFVTAVPPTFITDGPGTGLLIRDRIDETEVDALFGSVDFSFTDSLSASLELRYTEETKTQESTSFGVTRNPSEEFSFVTPRVSLSWALSDNANTYASYATGVKSGGFNDTDFEPEIAFDEETIDIVEFGYKGRYNEGRTNFSAAVFFFEWDDLQFTAPTNAPGGFTNTTQNLGKADGFGAEFSLDGVLTDSFQYSIGAAWTQPEFDSNTIDVGSSRNCPDSTLPVTGCSTDVSGNTVPRASELQVSASGTYYFYLDNSEIYVRGDVSYESEKYARALQVQSYGENTTVNVRAGWTIEDWELALWGKNIFDEEFIRSSINEPEFGGFDTSSGTTAGSSTFTTAFPANTASWGITATYGF